MGPGNSKSSMLMKWMRKLLVAVTVESFVGTVNFHLGASIVPATNKTKTKPLSHENLQNLVNNGTIGDDEDDCVNGNTNGYNDDDLESIQGEVTLTCPTEPVASR